MFDPLSYDSLYDPHLQTYFQNRNVRKHLRKAGLINRNDEIIPRQQYLAAINERSRQEHIRALLSHGVVQRVIEIENFRQANVRNQLEADAKRKLVENIKETRQQNRQYLSKDTILLHRPRTSLSNSTHYIYQRQMKFLDGNKETPSRVSFANPSHTSTKTNVSAKHKSSTNAKATVNTKDRCQITMIYLGPQRSLDHEQQSDLSKSYEIMIMQQHCGGENLVLHRKSHKLNDTFTFESHRHSRYPFALSLYVDGIIDCRISVCCEYKHKQGVRLGGKRAAFAILNVQGGQPCLTCRFHEHMLNRPVLQGKHYEGSSISTARVKQQAHSGIDVKQFMETSSPTCESGTDATLLNPNDEHFKAKIHYETLLSRMNDKLKWEDNSRLQWQLGNICKEGLDDYEKALDHYLTCLEILSEHLAPCDVKLRNLFLSIAHVLLLQENNETHVAIEYFQRVLEIDSSKYSNNETNLINDHYYLGLLYRSEENHSQALHHFEKSLKYLISVKSKNDLGSCFYDNNYLTNEILYDQKAYESLSIANLPNLSELHFHLATTYEVLQQKQRALKHAQKALQLSTPDQDRFKVYRSYVKKLKKN